MMISSVEWIQFWFSFSIAFLPKHKRTKPLIKFMSIESAHAFLTFLLLHSFFFLSSSLFMSQLWIDERPNFAAFFQTPPTDFFNRVGSTVSNESYGKSLEGSTYRRTIRSHLRLVFGLLVDYYLLLLDVSIFIFDL